MKALEKPQWQRRKETKKRNILILVVLLMLVPLGVLAVYVLNKMNVADSIFTKATATELEINGKIINVRRGGDFQEALNRAQPGDTIMLETGATFKGNFKLPNKPGSEFITIRTSAQDSQLPAPDVRLDPAKYGAVLPKIVPVVKGEPAILAVNGAHHYRFIGIEFQNTVDGLYNIVQIGTTEETKIADLPHHIEFDRVYLHGSPTVGQRRGIAANGKHIVVKNSHFAQFKRQGEESQAIAIWASDGPCEITNNYLEAASEGVLIGGAGSAMKLTPADCLVRDNWFNKRLDWKGGGWVVKNFFEIKNGRRIKVENNLMTNNWLDAQDGTAILFTTREDNGGRTAIIEDVEFYNNVIRGAGNGINVYGSEGIGGRRLIIRNNVFEDLGAKWGGSGVFLKTADWNGLVIENNTVIHSGNITLAWGEPTKGLVLRGNIVSQNEYGFFGDGAGVGKAAIVKYFPGAVISNNIIIGGSADDTGGGNFYPSSIRQVGFVALERGDLRLAPGSQYTTKGLNGRAVGATLDVNAVGGTR